MLSTTANSKLARIAALFCAVLLVGWSVRWSVHNVDTQGLFLKQHDTSNPADASSRQDQAAVVIPNNDASGSAPHDMLPYGYQGGVVPQAITVTVEKPVEVTITETAIAAATVDVTNFSNKLGINGRPRLPIRPQDEIVPDPKDDGSHIPDSAIAQYIESILDLGNTNFWRMECPGQEEPGRRWEVLKRIGAEASGIKYLFALDLYNIRELLPRLIGTLIQTIKVLGPENCAISIVEGRSSDGTYNILHKLRGDLQDIGVTYWLQQSDIDPHGHGKDRIAELSKLRNMALSPLIKHPKGFDSDPLLFFVNDIAVCPDDLLEMIYQHQIQNATQTCAMDWVEGGNLFYDSWVSRSMTGNTFFEIPQDMSFAFSRNLFWDHPESKGKYEEKEPFQVFSCWGGMTVLDAKPFMSGAIKFRRSEEGECYGGEPQTLASDFVKMGLSKVMTVPYISVAYDNHAGALAKGIHKYTHTFVDVQKEIMEFEEDTKTVRIKWKKPPPRYRCMPSFVDQWWVDSVYDPSLKDE